MRPVLFLLAIVLSGCSSTTFYYPDGRKHFSTSADITGLTVTKDSISIAHADHSTPTIARSKLVNGYTSGAAGIVTALGASALLK